MKNLWVFITVPLLALAACSVSKTDEKDQKLDKFEQRNVVGSAPSQAAVAKEERFARMALTCINQQYPNKISHVLNSAADVAQPVQLTPAFYGCFDWHSAVHGHWLLVRLWGLDTVPALDTEIVSALDANLTERHIAQEVAYFSADGREAFERPYGMAWLLQLTAELREIAKGDGPKAAQAKIWMVRLEPLEAKIVVLLKGWLPKLAYPIRIGTHNQTAFAFGLMHDWAKMAGDDEMAELVRGKTLEFHAQDKNCPIGYEPSGEDFLSPCLMEADLIRRVMSPMGFANWLGEFLPQIPRDGTGDWLAPGVVRDKSDGKLVHLDGLNLSRAWALQGIAAALPEDDPRRASLLAAAKIHATVGEEAVANPSYAGSHWLASFATYLETKRGIAGVQPGTRGAPVAVTE